jgi:hypothetical protein
VLVLVAGACGGDDDDAADTTTTIAVTVAPTTVAATAAPTTARATTTTTIAVVTEGATVVVANASTINGAAGRMTDAIAIAGFSTGEATNSSEAVGQLSTSQIHYDPEVAGAEAVANSLRSMLGGGDIEVVELSIPAPTDSGDIGDAAVLLMMGNDIADKSLAELQSGVDASDDATDDDAADDG